MRRLLSSWVALSAVPITPLHVSASTIVVSSTGDDVAVNGNCTLREAVLTRRTPMPSSTPVRPDPRRIRLSFPPVTTGCPCSATVKMRRRAATSTCPQRAIAITGRRRGPEHHRGWIERRRPAPGSCAAHAGVWPPHPVTGHGPRRLLCLGRRYSQRRRALRAGQPRRRATTAKPPTAPRLSAGSAAPAS